MGKSEIADSVFEDNENCSNTSSSIISLDPCFLKRNLPSFIRLLFGLPFPDFGRTSGGGSGTNSFFVSSGGGMSGAVVLTELSDDESSSIE
jgi:hypothetical protein